MQDVSLVLTNTMPDDPKQKALESAQEFVKYLVVLGVGALGYALAMLQPTERDSRISVLLVVISALILAGSIFTGILAYGSLIMQIYNNDIDLEDSYLSWQTRLQWILFFVGMIVLGTALFVRDVLRPHTSPSFGHFRPFL